MILKTGVDILEIARLENIQPRIRKRFLERVFTPEELSTAGQSQASLAGRFAAKEAVAKALGCGIGPVRWKDLEIKRGESGEPILELHGAAIEIASRQGLTTWSISISHNQTQAIAMAVAIGPD